MGESIRRLLPHWRDRRSGIVLSAVLALLGVGVILAVVLPGSKSTANSSAPGTGTGSSSGLSARTSAAAPVSVPTQVAADEASAGHAIKPTNSLPVAVWNGGGGGAAWRAVSSQLGTVLMIHSEKQVSALRQACQVLGSTVATALAAPPIPDATMELWYKRALSNIGAGAADCRAGITSDLHGDEDLVVHQDTALINRAMSDLSTGSDELYKATAYIKAVGRP